MARKYTRHNRTGHGDFPPGQPVPIIITVVEDPLHTSDQWEDAGCPFWILQFPTSSSLKDGPDVATRYARTLCPTFCPLGVVVVPPLLCSGVMAGTDRQMRPARWGEHRDYASAIRSVRSYAKWNPFTLVSVDKSLTSVNAQQYAVPGDIRQARGEPRMPHLSQHRPPDDQLREADDGNPISAETEVPMFKVT